jgi:hypothetical protein
MELGTCTASFDQINWESETLADALKDFQCPDCSSTLLRNANASAKEPADIHLVCSKCAEEADLEDVIEVALKGSLRIDEHISIKDGGDSLLELCPECSRETYVRYEDQCVNPGCGFSLNGVECALCSADLTLDDYSYGNGRTCSYCEHVMSKDD